MSLPVIISIIAVALTLLGLIFTYFGWIVDIKEKLGGLLKVSALCDYNAIVTRLGKLETAVEVIKERIGKHSIADMAARLDIFWVAMEPALKEIIKQPIHFRKDNLLDRFPELPDDELCELKDILKLEMVELNIAKSPKLLAYALMIARVDTELYSRHSTCK